MFRLAGIACSLSPPYNDAMNAPPATPESESRRIDLAIIELAELAASGEHAKIGRLLSTAPSLPRSRVSLALANAAANGHVECVKLLAPRSNPKAHDSLALCQAAENGHDECVRILLPRSNPLAGMSSALRLAASNGHAECVKLLAPASMPGGDNAMALAFAALNGHAECVKLLIPFSQAKLVDSTAFRWAAESGHVDCAKLLIFAQDPSTSFEAPLFSAIANGHTGIVTLLLAHQPALIELLDLPCAAAEASERGRGKLAAFFLSIHERESLAEIASADGASSTPRPSARL